MASSPAADQSAHVTFSATWRGFPPASGTNAKVPLTAKPNHSGRKQTANSPVGETAKRATSRNPRGWASGLPVALAKTSRGWPSQAALNITRPSGLKRAADTLPSRVVMSSTKGVLRRVVRPATYVNAARPSAASTPASGNRQRRHRRNWPPLPHLSLPWSPSEFAQAPVRRPGRSPIEAAEMAPSPGSAG